MYLTESTISTYCFQANIISDYSIFLQFQTWNTLLKSNLSRAFCIELEKLELWKEVFFSSKILFSLCAFPEPKEEKFNLKIRKQIFKIKFP